MKVALVFLAVLGISCALPAVQYSLQDDLDEVMALIPMDKIKEICENYKNDPDMLKIQEYLKSKEFAKVVEFFKNEPEIRMIVDYIELQGVKIKEFINEIAKLLNLPGWDEYVRVYGHSTRNLHGFFEEIKAALPLEDILALCLDKLANSEHVQGLYDMIASINGISLHDRAMQQPEIRDCVKRLNDMGVDTKSIWELIKSLFGWESYARRHTHHTYSLREDLDALLAFIPVDKLKAILKKYENDPQVQSVIAYVKSEEFAKIVLYIIKLSETRDLVNFLESEGLHVIDLYNKIADELGLPHYPGYAYGKSTYSLEEFFNEVLQALPVDDIVAFLLDRLANSPSFAELYEKIAAMDGPKLLEEAKTHPEIVNGLQFLRSLGVPLDEIWEVLKGVFGWN